MQPSKSNERLTSDPYVFLNMGGALTVLVLALIAWVVLSLLLVPVALLNHYVHFGAQFAIIVVATASLVALLLLMSRAQISEIIIAGATSVSLMIA